MNSFELNKILGAILGTLLFVMGVGFLAEAIYAPTAHGPGFELPLPEGAEGEGVVAEEEPQVSLGTLLASANVDQGKAVTSKCQACHSFVEGAGNRSGPELYNVVGRQIASFPDFSYSDDLEAHGAAGEAWTYENLAAFLESPKGFAPKTKMTFAGVKNPQELANLLAYLATLSANPVPFPAPEDAAADGAVAEAEAETAVPTEGEAIDTPTTTQTETMVEGTPANEGTEGGAMAPAEPVPEVPAQQ